MFTTLATLILVTITLLPALPAVALVSEAGPWAAPLALLAYLLGYGLVAGTVSRLFSWAIKPGKYSRDLSTPLYRDRRLYGLCWTSVYYNPPVLHLFLAVPILKTVLLRLFGYQGALDATLYPDTWIRDLPIVDLAPGAYLANKSTIGTNLVLANGEILVGRVSIGARAVVGHGAGLAPGVRIGDGAEIGFSAAVGIMSRIGARCRVGGKSAIEHGVVIGKDVVIGIGSIIGSGARIGDGLIIPAGTVVPPRTALRNQGDVELLLAGGRRRRRSTAKVAIAMESSVTHSGSSPAACDDA